MIKLLIVDDSALMRRLLRDIFARAGGFELRSARDGAEALAMIKADRPDVVTLDITMPEMDGLTCLSRIMVEAPCPVVMVSALTAQGAEAALDALQLGAVDTIGKPEGILSLSIEGVRQRLVEKVRAAAAARLRSSFRLTDRVRHRTGAAAPAMPDRYRPHRGIVLIGSSTGGPRAVEAVLTGLPASFPMPVLVAQHMPASFTGVFAKRLDQICDLEVVEVAGPMPIEPGRVYIGRGDSDLVVSGAAVPGGNAATLCGPASPSSLWQPSVDRLVTSCRMHYPAASIVGVLMTGMGSDGAAAMTALHADGGRTIAEAESTAVVWGMPGELVRRGGAGKVLPLHDIADALTAMVAHHAA
jgi:two-component system chemotaxis response regulator CheB